MSAPETKAITTAQPVKSPTVSQKLSDYVAGYSYDAIPTAVRERAKYLMLDAIGIAYASTHYAFAHHPVGHTQHCRQRREQLDRINRQAAAA
jgi:2-methylcitrate dehydratase PrpD